MYNQYTEIQFKNCTFFSSMVSQNHWITPDLFDEPEQLALLWIAHEHLVETKLDLKNHTFGLVDEFPSLLIYFPERVLTNEVEDQCQCS